MCSFMFNHEVVTLYSLKRMEVSLEPLGRGY